MTLCSLTNVVCQEDRKLRPFSEFGDIKKRVKLFFHVRWSLMDPSVRWFRKPMPNINFASTAYLQWKKKHVSFTAENAHKKGDIKR